MSHVNSKVCKMHVKRYLPTELVKSIFVGILKKFQYIWSRVLVYPVTFSEQLFYQAVYMLKSYVAFPANIFNPFVPNAPFLYPLKTSENCKVFSEKRKGALGTNGLN